MGLAIVFATITGTVTAQELTSNESGVPPAAGQITFGSNLFVDPCTGCNYDSNVVGYAVLGPRNCIQPGTSERLAVSFIAAATGTPERISAAIILYDPVNCPTDTITLSIYTDACYPRGPGKRLVSGQATVPLATCALAVAKLSDSPTLTAGTKYWVVATTNARQMAFDANWYPSNNAQVSYDQGAGWFQYSGGTPAFMVQGSGTASAKDAHKASHPVFGSNLFVDVCNGCNYDPNATGFPVQGPDNCTHPGQASWLGVPFIAEATGVPRRISASAIISNVALCPTNKVTLSIYTDACYPIGPGAPLVSGEATVPAAPCDLAVASLRNAPSLTKGIKYWMVASTNTAQAGLDASWYGANMHLGLNLGVGWEQF